jgi:hypothetical protein
LLTSIGVNKVKHRTVFDFVFAVNLTRFHGVFVRGGPRVAATTKQSVPRDNKTSKTK